MVTKLSRQTNEQTSGQLENLMPPSTLMVAEDIKIVKTVHD